MVASGGHTVGELADALAASDPQIRSGVDRRAGSLVIDSRPVGRSQRLADVGLVHGSRVAVSTTACATNDPTPTTVNAEHSSPVEWAAVGGIDCTAWLPLAPGRHLIGRGPAVDMRVDDPCIELHHVAIEVPDQVGFDPSRAATADDADQSVLVTQLSGRVPIRANGANVGPNERVDLPTTLTIGAVALRLRRSEPSTPTGANVGTLMSRDAEPWRRVVQRAPAPDRPQDPAPIECPTMTATRPAPPATGLIGAAVAVVGAVVIGVVLGQMMFAMFALLGAVASASTWLVGVVSMVRANRRARADNEAKRAWFVAEIQRQADEARQVHESAVVDLAGVLEASATLDFGPLADAGTDVWRERPIIDGDEHCDSMSVCVGRGSVAWEPQLEGDLADELASSVDRVRRLADLPVTIEWKAGDVWAVRGGGVRRDALVRSMLCQLAIRHGPVDWHLIIVSADPERWSWSSWLPHCNGPTATIDPLHGDQLAEALAVAAEATSVTVLVIDNAELLTVRTGALRRFIERCAPVTLVTLDETAGLPAVCDHVVHIGATGGVDVTTGDGRVAPTALAAGLSIPRASDVARRLAPLIDPEYEAVDAQLPTNVDLDQLSAADLGAATTPSGRRHEAGRLVRRWRQDGADPAPRVALGRSGDGTVEIDLVADGPHALIAGTTGSGKSELLRSMVIGLALAQSPEMISFVLVDYKGGSTFDRCVDLPHTVGLVTDLDGELAERALISLNAELHRRESLLREIGAADLAEYRAARDGGVLEPLPRLVVVIDEFAALAKELPEFLAALVGVAQRGRSLGVHLVLATQRPAGVVDDDIRANTNLRIALRLNDRADATDVINDAMPTQFSRSTPGRAALRLGPEELIVFQAACCLQPTRPANHGGIRVESALVSDAEAGVEAPSELDVAVALINDSVMMAQFAPPHRPWIDPLPARITAAAVDVLADTVDHDGIGVLDDPEAQCRRVLRWRRDLGNLALIGSVGVGTSTTLRAIVAARSRHRRPAEEHWYIVSARNDAMLDSMSDLAHVGAVVSSDDRERLHRVLRRLVDRIDSPTRAPDDDTSISLAVDGLSTLRTALGDIDSMATLELLDRVLVDGPAAGVMTCWTDDGPGLSTAAPAQTWVFRCNDPGVAHSVGVEPVTSDSPGRLRVSTCGRAGLVAVDAAHIKPCASASPHGAPPPVEVLASNIAADATEATQRSRATAKGSELELGVAFDDLAPARLVVPRGDHILVVGESGTGKSTALDQIANAWAHAHPRAQILRVDRSSAISEQVNSVDADRDLLLVIDDAARVGDDGLLAEIASGAPMGSERTITLAAASRLEAVRSAYGHWTRDVARSRCGVILTSVGEVDGDLLGALLPRRLPIAPRPGLAWLVDAGGQRLVQLFGTGAEPERDARG